MDGCVLYRRLGYQMYTPVYLFAVAHVGFFSASGVLVLIYDSLCSGRSFVFLYYWLLPFDVQLVSQHDINFRRDGEVDLL